MKRSYKRTAMASVVCVFAALSICGGCSESRTDSSEQPPYGTYEDWQPTIIIERVHYTDEEMREFWLAAVERSRSSHEVNKDVPIPEIVRWLEPGEPQEPIAQCMRDAGYDTIADATGFGLESTIAPGLELQMWKCQAMYPSSIFVLPRNNDVERVIYEYNVDYFIPCAEAHGVKFISEIPAKELYVQAQTDPYSYPDFIWEPNFMGDSDWDKHSVDYFMEHPEEAAQLYKDCPAFPPAQYLRVND